jgi:hypothetical protein
LPQGAGLLLTHCGRPAQPISKKYIEWKTKSAYNTTDTAKTVDSDLELFDLLALTTLLRSGIGYVDSGAGGFEICHTLTGAIV